MRQFDEDPRFGLIVLSEIASRGLLSAVNNPGTAPEGVRLARIDRRYRHTGNRKTPFSPGARRAEKVPQLPEDLTILRKLAESVNLG